MLFVVVVVVVVVSIELLPVLARTRAKEILNIKISVFLIR